MNSSNTSDSLVKKSGKPRIVTAVIICMCVIFVLLIANTLIKKNNGASASGQGQNPNDQSSANASGTGGSQQTRNVSVVQITPVSTSTIENSVVINGDVLARNQVSIFPTVAGKLAEARLGIGDRVDRGDIVAMVDPSRPGEVYSHSPVISTISGTVLQAPFSIGDTLSTQSAVYVVGDLSGLRVETFVPERFVSSIRLGLGAQIRLEAIPDEIFYAVIDEASPVLDPASRTLRIRLRFANWPSGQNVPEQAANLSGDRVKAGMFATISLVTQTRANVLVIPRMSVINTYGSWIVFVVGDDGIARRVQVELGIENEEFIEVLHGLELGERVVSAGQNFLSDGDPVRIVN